MDWFSVFTLKRTDTTLDLSLKAEKVQRWKCEGGIYKKGWGGMIMGLERGKLGGMEEDLGNRNSGFGVNYDC